MEKIRSLEEVQAYENENLVRLFAKKKMIELDESRFLFGEVKKLLWFMAQRDAAAGPFVIFAEQNIMDDFWHEFILTTKDYHEFCSKYFGRYVHHVPQLEGLAMDGSGFGIPASLAVSDKKKYIEEKLILLRNAMLEVSGILGPHTVKIWYDDLPKKYFYPFYGVANQ